MKKSKSGNKTIVYFLILFAIINMVACNGVTQPQKIPTNIEGKENFIHIIINDKAIKSKKYGSKLVGKIEEAFRMSFENVSVQTGYYEPKSNEVLIIPKGLSCVWGDPAKCSRCMSRSQITVIYNNDYQYYEIAGNENGLPEMSQTKGDIIGVAEALLVLPTLGLNMVLTQELMRKKASDKALASIAAKLYNKVVLTAYFKDYAASIKLLKTAPASLIAKIKYSDKASILPNASIDAGEKSTIIGTIANNGKGTAFDVNIITLSSYQNINFPEKISIGNIRPNESKKITIPIEAALPLVSGTVSFRVEATEKRGYSTRPIELQIQARKLQSPKLLFSSCNVNDSSGLANGDGDGIPENNETIELNPYISNKGEGDALKISVKLAQITKGIEIVKGNYELQTIRSSTIKKSTLAFKIPRTFAQPEIKYTISATDVRGMRTEKNYTIPFKAKSPELKFSYKIIDSNNQEAPYLENGRSYRLLIIPENIGNNDAKSVSTSIKSLSSNVSLGKFNNDIGTIRPGFTGRNLTVPLELNRSFSESSLVLQVNMEQESFTGIEKKITLAVQLKNPDLKYKVTLLNGENKDSICRNSSSTFRIAINNQGDMDAENVKIHFRSMKDDIKFNEEKNIGRIRSGENQFEDFTFFVRRDVETGNFPVKLNIYQTDFNTITTALSYKIVKQTALVQKIKSLEQDSSGGSRNNTYTSPPQLYINTPDNNIKTIKQTLNLHGSIIPFGTANAIQDLTITLNGRSLSIIPVPEKIQLDPDIITKRESDDNKIIFNGTIKLDSGKNIIKINGTDRNGLKSSQTITVIKQATLGNIYAVVIGISKFFNRDYNLEFAAEDALKFNNFLRSNAGGNLSDNRIKFLDNHKASRANIIHALTSFLGQTSKEDIVEIYLATHGCVGMDGKLYYLCHDTDVDNLKGTGFSDKYFNEILVQDIKAGKVIIYLDTCHAGLSGLSSLYAKRNVGVIDINRQINKLADKISSTKNGVAKFSASSANGYSLEDSTLNGGVFTHWLIKGLNGKADDDNNQWVTAIELEKYLRKNVTMATKGKQTPKAVITMDNNTPLAKVK